MRVWDVSLSPKSAYPDSTDSRIVFSRIWSLVGLDRLRFQNHLVALPREKLITRLYLNISRGEPAISGFDRHITPNHKSSHVISPTTGSDLPPIFIEVHPAHG